MANKKNRCEYTTIKEGRTLPVEELKPKETIGVEEMGRWVGGKAQEPQPLFKVDIGVMKTHQRAIQRGTSQLDLFGIKYIERELERQSYPAKMGIVLDQLLIEWQRLPKDKNGFVKITKLKPLAKKLKCTPQQFKGYLVNIAGYLYPLVIRGDKDIKTGKWREIAGNVPPPLEIYFEYLVDIDKEEVSQDKKVGTKLACYIRDNPVKAVWIKPNEYIRRSLENGEGYGFLYTTGNLPQLQLGWSYIAIKLYNFIYTYENNPNNPLKKISYEKLIKQLDLEKYAKQQGKPRTMEEIKKALDMFIQEGQLESYTAPDKNAKRLMYSWVRSYKDIKQRQPRTKRKV